MTKKVALNVALNLINDALDATTEDDLTEYVQELKDAKDTVALMIEQVSKKHAISDESKAKANEKRKIANANARAELVAKVAPVLREVLSHTLQGMTAKDIFADAQAKLPSDFTANKVQNVLLREMREELEIIDNGRNAKTYRMRGE